MNAIELLALARQDFEAKLAMVEDDQWALPTPCTEWNVRALVNHVVAGNLMNVALLFGASTGEARKVWRSDSLGADPRGAFARSADELDTAFREQTDMDRMITHPHGEMSISRLLRVRTSDYEIHAWDIAVAVHGNVALNPAVIGALWEAMASNADFIASTGVYGEGPSGTLRDDAPLQKRLLDLTGRRPF
jgi:uncharacterized protein (TIGR03086 family)